jgi:hypothetical protein
MYVKLNPYIVIMVSDPPQYISIESTAVCVEIVLCHLFYKQTITISNQKAASSVVFSDVCNLNLTVYLYVFSCISLFYVLYNSSCRAPEFDTYGICIIYVHFLYDSHILSLHIMASSLTKTLKNKLLPRIGFEP